MNHESKYAPLSQRPDTFVDFLLTKLNTFVFQFTNNNDSKYSIKSSPSCTTISNISNNQLVKFEMDIPLLKYEMERIKFSCAMSCDFTETKKILRIHLYGCTCFVVHKECQDIKMPSFSRTKRQVLIGETIFENEYVCGYVSTFENNTFTSHAEKLTPADDVLRMDDCKDTEIGVTTSHEVVLITPPLKLTCDWYIYYIIKNGQMYISKFVIRPKSIRKIENRKLVERRPTSCIIS